MTTRGPSLAEALSTPIGVLMTRDVVCVRPDLDLETLEDILLAQDLAGVPVVDDRGRLIGYVELADVVAGQGPGIGTQTVRDVTQPMRTQLVESSSVADAAAVMASEHMQRIPVLSAARTLTGMLSASDIVAWLARGRGFHAAVPF